MRNAGELMPAEPQPSLAPEPGAPPVENDLLNRLGQHAALMGKDIVDIAGFLDDTDRETRAQLDAVDTVVRQGQELVRVRAELSQAVQAVTQASGAAMASVEGSVDALRDSAQKSHKIAGWVQQVEQQMSGVESTLVGVSTANDQISDIARQVNILAINAKIEAARAGEAGRGFSVVADAINELSQMTASAADGIHSSITELSKRIEVMRAEAEQVGRDARQVLDSAGTADAALSGIAGNMRQSAEQTDRITDSAARVGTAVTAIEPAFDGIARAMRDTADGVHMARDRVNGLVDYSEAVVQMTVELGGASEDAGFIDLVRELADQVGQAFARGVSQGAITLQALFDRRYRPIPGTDPQQLLAPFTEFTDRVLPAFQEPALDHDRRVVFCAAVDTNGYLPTHNRKFSAPQGDDPVRNAAHSRNRRLFDDRVGLKAGRNTAPFLLQTYRRDMGGGNFVLMKDVSAPIRVQGRHWGGLRLAFRPQT